MNIYKYTLVSIIVLAFAFVGLANLVSAQGDITQAPAISNTRVENIFGGRDRFLVQRVKLGWAALTE